MKYLLIEDNKQFAEALCKHLLKNVEVAEIDKTCNDKTLKFSNGEDFIAIDFSKHTTREIADAIIETHDPAKNKKLILFINVNLHSGKDSRQQQKGIELLIWLRIKGVMNHCVLYSFETFHTLLNRKHEHLIAASFGTSFIQLPDGFCKFDYSKQHENVANKEDIKKTLKAIFDSGDKGDIIRYKHRGANWWGVKALCEVYKVIEDSNFKYPSHVDTELLILNNAIIKFIYQLENTKLEEIIDQERKSREIFIASIRPKLTELEEKLEESKIFEIFGLEDFKNIINEIAIIENSLSSYYSTDLIEDRKKLLETKTKIEGQLNEIQQNSKLIETNKTQLDENIITLNAEIKNIMTILKTGYEMSSKYYNNKTKNNIINRNPSILYIDDNANKGWHEIISKMLAGSTIQAVVPDNKYQNNIAKLYEEQIKNKITDSISLIMLDLRLYDEDNRSADIQNISGKKLLDIIRINHKGLPVLITTASNKIWSYEELMKAGADAYWIKEGIDNQFDEKESIENYFRFQWLVENLTDEKYKLLKILADSAVKIISATQSHWWEKKDWGVEIIKQNFPPLEKQTRVDKMELKNIYLDGLDLYRKFLSLTLNPGFSLNTNNNDWFYYSSIIVHMAKIIELIHNLNNQVFKTYRSFSGVIEARKDKKGNDLYSKRNDAAHLEKSKSLKYYDFKYFIVNLNNYLFPNTL